MIFSFLFSERKQEHPNPAINNSIVSVPRPWSKSHGIFCAYYIAFASHFTIKGPVKKQMT